MTRRDTPYESAALQRAGVCLRPPRGVVRAIAAEACRSSSAQGFRRLPRGWTSAITRGRRVTRWTQAMAKSKPAPTGKAKKAKVPAKSKPVAAKAKKAPVKAAAKPKRAVVPAKKTPPKAATKPAAKPVKAAAKSAPVKSAPPPKPAHATKKPVAASKPVERPSHQEAQSGKSVSTTKSVVSTAAPMKGPKARAVAPAADTGVTMQDGRYALPTSVRIELP